VLYRLYIYKTSAVTAKAPAIGICNLAVSTNSENVWKLENAEDYMCNFDAEKVAKELEYQLGNKCRIYHLRSKPQYGKVEYLCIATSYAHAAEVLPYIHCVTASKDLVLYDAETKQTFFRELVNNTFITVKSRISDITQAILSEMKPVWSIRKIGESSTDRDHDYCYVVTLRKSQNKAFKERCKQFHDCLTAHLNQEEILDTSDECFTIRGQWYSISFCLEGYKKHPDQLGYFHHGYPRTKLIRRMGCEEAFRWVKQSNSNLNTIIKRMTFRELEQAYPNPADRFVKSVNISKWESRCGLGVRYCGIGFYGSEILFHIVPDEYYEDQYRESRHISVLAVREGIAAPILSVVEKYYPYFSRRYYLEENHLPIEMLRQIVDDAKEERAEYTKTHKYDHAKLLDIFIQWSEAQLYLYEFTGEGRMINVQGP